LVWLLCLRESPTLAWLGQHKQEKDFLVTGHLDGVVLPPFMRMPPPTVLAAYTFLLRWGWLELDWQASPNGTHAYRLHLGAISDYMQVPPSGTPEGPPYAEYWAQLQGIQDALQQR
jgi:hypothetical protein